MRYQKLIPSTSIQQTLAGSGELWDATDYYIGPDGPLTTKIILFRPDYYTLFICLEGSIKGKVNYNTIELLPYCLTDASPETEIEITEVSADCTGRYLFFTRDFLLRNNISPALLDAFHYLAEQVGYFIQLDKKEAAILLQLYSILLQKRTADNSAYHVEIIGPFFYFLV